MSTTTPQKSTVSTLFAGKVFRYFDWEKRAFALFAGTFVFGGYTVDEFRHEIEKMDPAHYLEASYYEHWLAAFEGLLINHGHITRKELDDRVAQLKKESH